MALRITLCQLSTGPDVAANLADAESAIHAAVEAGSQLAVLPENVWCRGSARELRASAAKFAEFSERLGPLSQGVATVWGGVPLRDGDQFYNTALVFDAQGRPICEYRKNHLFQLFGGPREIDETQQYTPGAKSATFELAGWRIFLSICYDLRFPELYRSAAGAELMLCPANFTKRTGGAHWRVLARARAIENQCYFAAVGQCGQHAALQIQTHGHSLLVDPWGEILGELGDEPANLHLELSRQRISEVRESLPALRSIRHPVSW
jgi:predicted amidohydrolase